jgi:hypothetical protein
VSFKREKDLPLALRTHIHTRAWTCEAERKKKDKTRSLGTTLGTVKDSTLGLLPAPFAVTSRQGAARPSDWSSDFVRRRAVKVPADRTLSRVTTTASPKQAAASTGDRPSPRVRPRHQGRLDD